MRTRNSAIAVCAAIALLAVGCVEPPPPAPSFTTVDFNDQSETADPNIAQVVTTVPDGRGNVLQLGVAIGDFNLASDGGYSWLAFTFFQNVPSESCRYPIVQVRARVNIADGPSSGTYRLDFDGYDADGYIDFTDVPGPWDYDNGDRPTLIVESMTIDLSHPASCASAP